MTSLLLQIGATKLAVSVVLAGAAWVVQRRVGRPAVSHGLWLLVLVTLLVPAVVSLPVLPAEPVVQPATPGVGGGDFPLPGESRPFSALAVPGLVIAWLLGTAGLLGRTLARTVRFQRTLRSASRPAPAALQREAAAIGRVLGLARTPEVHTTGPQVAPMVWWAGGKVRVLVPTFLPAELDRDQLRAVLAHELAHVRRRDHLVRWLEWLACSVFWWNPVSWWSRRQLRIAEEACCDRLALNAGRFCPRTYANALLLVVAKASEPPGFRPPPPASAAIGVGRTRVLETRLRMIVAANNGTPAPRWPRALTWMAVLCALPFGLVYCDTLSTAAGPGEDTVDREVRAGAEAHATFLDEFEAGVHQRVRHMIERESLDPEVGRRLSAEVATLKNDMVAGVEAGETTEEEATTRFGDELVRLFDRTRGRGEERVLRDASARISEGRQP